MKSIIEHADSLNEFITLEDGYVYYWPAGFAGGAFAAYQLREIADELDRRNDKWDKQVQEDMS